MNMEVCKQEWNMDGVYGCSSLLADRRHSFGQSPCGSSNKAPESLTLLNIFRSLYDSIRGTIGNWHWRIKYRLLFSREEDEEWKSLFEKKV